MSANLSETVRDVAAAAEKLRADDRLITDTGLQLEEIESLLDSITVLQSAVTDRVAEAAKVGATAEQCGRSPRRWLAEDCLMAGPGGARDGDLAEGVGGVPPHRGRVARE